MMKNPNVIFLKTFSPTSMVFNETIVNKRTMAVITVFKHRTRMFLPWSIVLSSPPSGLILAMVNFNVSTSTFGRILSSSMILLHAHVCHQSVSHMSLVITSLVLSNVVLFHQTLFVLVLITLTKFTSIVVCLIINHVAGLLAFTTVPLNFMPMKLSTYVAACHALLSMTSVYLVTGLNFAVNVFVSYPLKVTAGVVPLVPVHVPTTLVFVDLRLVSPMRNGYVLSLLT